MEASSINRGLTRSASLPEATFLLAIKGEPPFGGPPRALVGQPAGRAALRPVPAGAARALPATKTERQTIKDAARATTRATVRFAEMIWREEPQGAPPPAPPALLIEGLTVIVRKEWAGIDAYGPPGVGTLL